MPGSRCPVKEKMLYSSCKAPILDVIEQQIGIEIERKVHTNVQWVNNWDFCAIFGHVFVKHRFIKAASSHVISI